MQVVARSFETGTVNERLWRLKMAQPPESNVRTQPIPDLGRDCVNCWFWPRGDAPGGHDLAAMEGGCPYVRA